MRSPARVLNSLTKHSQTTEYRFERLYRILFNEEMYYLAFQRISAKPGNMTQGADGKTIDRMSLSRIEKLILSLKDESYSPQPSRRVHIPKKNGKSELAAGLGLYHLLADGEQKPDVGIFAVDTENADIIYQCAKCMVEHSVIGQPQHRPLAWARPSVREIRTRFGGRMKVYSGDVDNKHGPSFSAILCDELHAWSGRAGRERWSVQRPRPHVHRLGAP